MRKFAATALLAMILSTPAESQQQTPSALSYADLADISLSAPVAAHVRISSAVRLKGEQAAAVPAGRTRFYVEAQILSLLRGPAGVPATLKYLVDLPNNAEGKPPKLAKKSEHLIVGSLVAGRPGELRLSAPDAQIAWTAADGERVRRILGEASSANAAPAIVGIGRAFNSPGALPGEGETQIFLQTARGEPVSLSVLRRPGQEPRWGVALGEIVDDAAGPPARDTLLWYRLACTLPRQLPPQSLAEADAAQAQAVTADYALILERLGACTRTRSAGSGGL